MASTSPHNFSWVEPGKLAGLALPRMTSEYQYLLDNGIKHLVCLCERKPPYYDSCPELKLHHIKIVDFTPPSPSQIERFLSIVEEANSKGEVRTQILGALSGLSMMESSIIHSLTSHMLCNLIHFKQALLTAEPKANCTSLVSCQRRWVEPLLGPDLELDCARLCSEACEQVEKTHYLSQLKTTKCQH